MSERRMTGRVWEIVESGRDADRASAAFDLFILASIVVSIVGLVLGTVERYDAAPTRSSSSLKSSRLASLPWNGCCARGAASITRPAGTVIHSGAA